MIRWLECRRKAPWDDYWGKINKLSRSSSESKLNPFGVRKQDTQSWCQIILITSELDVSSTDISPSDALRVQSIVLSVKLLQWWSRVKGVTFSTIEIADFYPIMLGDNPWTTGPTFHGDWDHQDAERWFELNWKQKRTRGQIFTRIRESWLQCSRLRAGEILRSRKG
jgi:hypothetical protein